MTKTTTPAALYTITFTGADAADLIATTPDDAQWPTFATRNEALRWLNERRDALLCDFCDFDCDFAVVPVQ